MKLDAIARLDNLDGDWEPQAWDWRATHSQQGWAMCWTIKPVQGEIYEDGIIVAEFKSKIALILRGNETIEDLSYKLAKIVKNFEPKTRKKFKGISKAIFKYGAK